MIRNRYLAAVNDKPWWLAGGIPREACVAAYQPIRASDYEASKVNLTGNTAYNAVDGAAYPTWTVNAGWVSDLTLSQYLMTGITLSHSYNWSGIIKYSGAIPNTRRLFFGWKIVNSGEVYGMNGLGRYYLSGWKLGAGAGDKNGVWFAGSNSNPESAIVGKSGLRVFLDGTYTSSITNAAEGVREISIFATNCLNGIGEFITTSIQSMAIYNTTLTDAQVSALTLAMNAL